MTNETDLLLEPSQSFEKVYKERFETAAKELLDALVKKSGIDEEENRKTAKAHRDKKAEADKVGKKLRGLGALRTLLIILAVLGVIVAIGAFYMAEIAVGAVSLVVAVGAVLLIFLVIKKKRKALQEIKEKLDAEAQLLYDKAWAQMQPLLTIFDNNMTYDLIRKTLPTLVIDDTFDNRRYDYMEGKYGLPDNPGDEDSTLGVLSGEIIGNPFLFEKIFRHKMGMQTYEGTKVIHWTTYSRDSKGHTVAHHHTQTLHAHVRKPKPFYSTLTRLVYGNDAAPDLSFLHERTHCEKLNEKQLESTVKKNMKEIRKKAKENMSSGFTEMGNEAFDALFGATDRDNEVQFRLLFTPLAQQNMLDLMKGGSPYGDDFNFAKRKCLNYIISEHAQTWDIDTDCDRYNSYDIDITRKTFTEYNQTYFRSFFFDMAPLLSVPLYQQNKPREYIYHETYNRNYTTREAEILANKLGYKNLAHPASATPAILKTTITNRRGEVDTLRVTAYSYRAVRRVDYVTVHGRDGRFHQVPVYWYEYFPLSRESEMEISHLDMTEKQYDGSRFAQAAAPNAFYHKLYATLGPELGLTDDNPNAADDADVGDIIESSLDEFDDDIQEE